MIPNSFFSCARANACLIRSYGLRAGELLQASFLPLRIYRYRRNLASRTITRKFMCYCIARFLAYSWRSECPAWEWIAAGTHFVGECGYTRVLSARKFFARPEESAVWVVHQPECNECHNCAVIIKIEWQSQLWVNNGRHAVTRSVNAKDNPLHYYSQAARNRNELLPISWISYKRAEKSVYNKFAK